MKPLNVSFELRRLALNGGKDECGDLKADGVWCVFH